MIIVETCPWGSSVYRTSGPLVWTVRRSRPLVSCGRARPASATGSSCFTSTASSNFASEVSVGSGRPQRSRPPVAVDGQCFVILLRNSFLAAGGHRGRSRACLGVIVGPAMAIGAKAFGSWGTAGAAARSVFAAAPRRSPSSCPSCFAFPIGYPRQRNAPPLAMVASGNGFACAWSRRELHAAGVFCLDHPAFAVRALPAS